MRKLFFVFLFMIFAMFFISSSLQKIEKVEKGIYGKLDKKETVKVIVELKEPDLMKGIFFVSEKSNEEIIQEKKEIQKNIIDIVGKEKIKHMFEKSIALEVSKKELDELEKIFDIKSIKIDKPLFAFLQDSVPYVNASSVWGINLSSKNITGIDETICVLDTGINFSHPALLGKNKTCVIDCFEKTCVENCSVSDDNGHGTHVAGIIGASGEINGVAVGSNIIGVKVLDSSGSGRTSDASAGINWCVENAATYNISVISMSLGADCDSYPEDCYDTYCDGASLPMTNAINFAVGKNISVIIASGNNGNTTHISSPSCIENATAVGWSNKVDTINPSGNRNNLVDLFAPGTNINSTCISGDVSEVNGYCPKSGTSMATPHVAGVFALFRQFFRLQNNRVPTPNEIKLTLNNTGILVDDSAGSGYNFSRIDIYSALISIDSSNPVVELISPANASTQFSEDVDFLCSANDVLLSNLTFYLWNSTNDLINQTTVNLTGTQNQSYFNLTNLSYDSYKWNCFAEDKNGNSSFATFNNSLTISTININLTFPNNNTFTNKNQTFNCSTQTNSNLYLTNLSFYLWNSTNDLIYNLSSNISGTSNMSSFGYNFTNEEKYFWNCKAYNNESNFAFADKNYTITYDLGLPNITLINPSDTSSYTSNSKSITFQYNVTDSFEIANCSLIINNASNLTNSSINQSLNQSFTQSFSPGSYSWKINCSDSAGNLQNSSLRNFTVTAPVVVNSGGGGGSSSRSVVISNLPKTYFPTSFEILTGYSKTLGKDDRMTFSFPSDKSNENHSLIVDSMSSSYVLLTIQSDPLKIGLLVGQEVKLNLTSFDYYDLSVKLENASLEEVNITIKIIYEKIPMVEGEDVLEEVKDEILEVEKEKESSGRSLLNKILITILLAIFIIIGSLLLKDYFTYKKKRKTKNEIFKALTKRKQKILAGRRQRFARRN